MPKIRVRRGAQAAPVGHNPSCFSLLWRKGMISSVAVQTAEGPGFQNAIIEHDVPYGV
jgi:hypothetical protein